MTVTVRELNDYLARIPEGQFENCWVDVMNIESSLISPLRLCYTTDFELHLLASGKGEGKIELWLLRKILRGECNQDGQFVVTDDMVIEIEQEGFSCGLCNKKNLGMGSFFPDSIFLYSELDRLNPSYMSDLKWMKKRAEDPFSDFDEDEMWKEMREEEEARWEADMDAALKEMTFGKGSLHRHG